MKQIFIPGVVSSCKFYQNFETGSLPIPLGDSSVFTIVVGTNSHIYNDMNAAVIHIVRNVLEENKRLRKVIFDFDQFINAIWVINKDAPLGIIFME